MRVLSIAFALAVVGDNAVGGAEQVLAQLDRGLVSAGHESLVVAANGSGVCGTLVPTCPAPQNLDSGYYYFRYREHARAIHEALRRAPIDLVHLHGFDFHEFLPEIEGPVLATLHLPPSWYPSSIFRTNRPAFFLNCVSATQRASAPDSALIVRTIPNGVPIPPLQPLPMRQRSGAALLGRICPEKRTHLAIAAARQAGTSLAIAGRVFGYPEHQAYFRHCVVPALGDRVRFLGPVGYAERMDLLRSARCLLLPSQAPETSSLASMEALACGTPVIAMHSGALPEIIEHGRTGFLVRSAHEMAAAISRLQQLDPNACRLAAVERFSSPRMVRDYLHLYREIIGRCQPPMESLRRNDWPLDTSQSF